MANNITFKVGNENSLPSSKITGQLLFALNDSSGSIYYDKDGSNRIKFNADALKLANARTLTIGNTGKTFDGSRDVSWSLSEIGAAAASHGTHVTNSTVQVFDRATIGTSPNYDNPGVNGLFEVRTTSETPGETGTKPFNSFGPFLNLKTSDNIAMLQIAANGIEIMYRANQAGGVTMSGVAWKTLLSSSNYNSYSPTLTGGGASGTWGISITGNAATATKLATARTINGTSFDGSGNITTANWGTARNITIGATTKSVNGSTNYSWSPYEMRVTRAQYGVDTSMNVIADNGCELGMASLSSSNTTINPGGGTGWHHYINMTWTDCADNNGTTTNEWCTQIANKVGSTDLWVRSRSGGSISDGTAWTAPWTRIVTGSNFTTVLNGTYVNVTGDTMTGALNFANGTWNTMGDDAYIGDYNQAGMIGIKGKNGATGLYFAPYSGSTAQSITINGAGTMTITGTVASSFSGNLNGNASTATHLKPHNSAVTYGSSTWGNMGTNVWGMAFSSSALGSDSGDIGLSLTKYSDSQVILNLKIDGQINAGSVRSDGIGFIGNLQGNASTATQLATARTINGTNFNGTGNITTSYWGTARNLTIGNTTKSVNGSADVSWPNPLKIAYYGSDDANTNGWYKVGTWSQSGYSDMNLNLLVTSGYGRRAMGIIYLAVRCDNNTTNYCTALKWLCRYGFNIGDFYFKDHGNNTWSLYVQQAVARYGRIQIQVLSETSTSAGQHNLTFNSNSTKESAAPTGGTVSTDGNFIYSSTEPSGRYEGMVWLKPTS